MSVTKELKSSYNHVYMISKREEKKKASKTGADVECVLFLRF